MANVEALPEATTVLFCLVPTMPEYLVLKEVANWNKECEAAGSFLLDEDLCRRYDELYCVKKPKSKATYHRLFERNAADERPSLRLQRTAQVNKQPVVMRGE